MARKKSVVVVSRADLALEGDLTIYTAVQQRDALLAWLVSGTGSTVVDLAQVSECDSAGVQLLLATQRTLRDQGCVLELRNLSKPVSEALTVYGIGLDLPCTDPQASQAEH